MATRPPQQPPPHRPSKVGSAPCLLSLFFADLISTCSTLHLDDFASDDIDTYMIAMETTVGSESSRTLPSISLSPGLQPPCHSEEEEEDEAELSTVPGTPPPKKVGAWGSAGGWGAGGTVRTAHSAPFPSSSAPCSLAPSSPPNTPRCTPAPCWLKTVRTKAEPGASSASRGRGLREATASRFSGPARGRAGSLPWWVERVGWAAAELAGPAVSPCPNGYWKLA